MKGLLIKDFCLLKSQKRFWVTVLAISLLFFGVYDNPSFVICYLSLMVAMFTSGTLNYDEYNNGMGYLLTLPVGRTGYVQEKYVFGFATSAVATGAGYLLAIAVSSVKGGQYGNDVLIPSVVAGIVIAFFMMAVVIPLQLKFGAEKGRMTLFVVYGITILAVYLAMKLFQVPLDDILAVIDRALENGVTAAVVCVGTSIAVLLVSYCISIWIMKKKEF